ncbi:hypothetical protein LV779_17190 [Streptomyces thinghirensis]|nr:hypothetical protein [Streptomyces thinghirensis]
MATGRATDRLALQEQDQVAAELGLLDADALLRQVYEAARAISYAGDVTWREVGRVLRSRPVRPEAARHAGRRKTGHRALPARRGASSSRTARWCSPAPRAPTATPCSRCVPRPPRRRPGSRLPARRATPRGHRAPAARALARRGTRAAGDPAGLGAGPPWRSGRRWRPRG